MKKNALYLIHGLGGDSNKTWRQLLSLLKTDGLISEHYDFFSYHFPTSLIRLPFTKRSLKIQDLAMGVRTEIETRLKLYDEIVIIGHSLGGIIARKYLIEQLKKSGANPK